MRKPMKKMGAILAMLCTFVQIAWGGEIVLQGRNRTEYRMTIRALVNTTGTTGDNNSAEVTFVFDNNYFVSEPLVVTNHKTAEGYEYVCTWRRNYTRLSSLQIDIKKNLQVDSPFTAECNVSGGYIELPAAEKIPATLSMISYLGSQVKAEAEVFIGTDRYFTSLSGAGPLKNPVAAKDSRNVSVRGTGEASNWRGTYPDKITLDVSDGQEKSANLLKGAADSNVRANVNVQVSGAPSLADALRIVKLDGSPCSDGLRGGETCVLYASNKGLPSGKIEGTINLNVSLP